MAPLTTADFGASPNQTAKRNAQILVELLDIAEREGAMVVISDGAYACKPDELPPYVMEVDDGVQFVDH